MAAETHNLLVATDGREVVGFVHAMMEEVKEHSHFRERRFVTINMLGVRKDHRHSGIGTQLMRSISEWALKAGIREIELTVWKYNRSAIAFYDSLGYRTINRKLRKEFR